MTSSHRSVVPLIVAGMMFMENLDATVIVTALPAVARTLATTPATLSLGISGYMMAVAVCVPLSAWLADRFGTKTIMTAAVLMFTVASILCGISGDLTMFVGMRVLQGASAALMTPAGRLVVLRNTPKTELMAAVAILTWPALIAPILGPPVGGFLTTYASWRWIFFINVPLGLVGAALTLAYIPQQRAKRATPFDWLGFVLIGTALASLVGGLELLGSGVGPRGGGAAVGAAGVALGLAAVRHIRRHPHPIVGLGPVGVLSFRITNITGGSLSRIAVGATPFLLPLMLQVAFGYSAFAAGGMILVYFAGNLGMKLFTTAIIRTFGFRRILMLNGVVLALSVGACGLLTHDSPLPVILGLFFVNGAFRSLQFTALNTLAFADVESSQTGAANTLNSLAQQIAITLGIAIAALALQTSEAMRHSATLSFGDFQLSFFTVAAFGLLAVFSYARLPHDTGHTVSGHRR